MKSVKLTINDGSPGRILPLFHSPEAAYIWLLEAPKNPGILDTIEDVELITLLPGEFLEAEWRGCEFTYDSLGHVRIDVVRLARAHKPQNASGLLVSIHYGWVLDCIIPFRHHVDNDITATPLTELDKSFDLAALFKDNDDEGV